jgi:flagellar hook assembly protein FlgD
VKQVASGKFASGWHQISWDGRNESGHAVSAGVYLYQLVVTGENGETVFNKMKRMTLVK